ncbi:MAG: NADP-dependent isocitrate dehydrogenase [Thermoplasmata archaeon]
MASADRTVTVPYIAGDGIGPEVMAAARGVIDAAMRSSTEGRISINWLPVQAGEAAFRATGEWLPEETLEAIRSHGVALKGPLTTPVGGGIRSLNVAIRQKLDLYACVRPVRYFEGVPSPVRSPEKMNVVIFRENTEDVYKGIEWKSGSPEARRLLDFMRSEFGVYLPPDTAMALKPLSETASKRLVRAAIRYAIDKKLGSVTLVHKGNIMKYTEGAFRDWGYEVARSEFRDMTVSEKELLAQGGLGEPCRRVVIKDRIADNMLQQILTRPEEYSVIATPNLNGDYLADACAAQVGGLGVAPGANIGESVAVFESVHGTAPKYAGKNSANPTALILSGAMMLEHLGFDDAGNAIVRAVEAVFREGILTQDLARISGSDRSYGTREFALEVASRIA